MAGSQKTHKTKILVSKNNGENYNLIFPNLEVPIQTNRQIINEFLKEKEYELVFEN